MAHRTQNDPKILQGKTIADLPLPYAMPQGTIFRADTGEARILVIDPDTGLRSWADLFALAARTAVMNFAGDVSGLSDEVPQFFANQIAGAISPTNLGYPSPSTAANPVSAVGLSVNVRENNIETGNFSIFLYINGAPYLPSELDYTVGELGMKHVAFSRALLPTEQVDVGIVSAFGVEGSIALTATLRLR